MFCVLFVVQKVQIWCAIINARRTVAGGRDLSNVSPAKTISSAKSAYRIAVCYQGWYFTDILFRLSYTKHFFSDHHDVYLKLILDITLCEILFEICFFFVKFYMPYIYI